MRCPSYRHKQRHGTQAIVAGLALVGLFHIGIAPVPADDEKPGEVESRGMPQLPMNAGVAPQPEAISQPNAQLPTFPLKFEVQGPEVDSFGFAVTQPGPVMVDVQAQGAPVIVTLQSPGGQPITQRATGNFRMN